MRSLLNYLRRGLAPVLIASLIVSSGCENKDVAGPGDVTDPPQIPPATTMLIDFSNFASNNPAPRALPGEGADPLGFSKQNWGWAALNVAVWNTFITVGLAVPVSAFVESFNHQPVLQPNGAWKWTYDFRVFNVKHTASLYGKLEPDKITWDMYITKENFYTDYHWFYGDCNLSVTEGTWTLNKAQNETPILLIEWHRNPADSTADVKYTNIEPGGAENGGYIFYGITTQTPNDAFYDIFNKGQNNHTNIEWSRETNAGRVKDSAHFNDNDWHCWDGNLDDGDCP